MPLAEEKETFPAGPKRSLAFWLDGEGRWVANALLATLVHLGLVERGYAGTGRAERWFFRLTDVGRAIFGAPEVECPPLAEGAKFLTVQPNHDVVVYLDAAGASDAWRITRMAVPTSAAGGPVRTFKLTRESIYAALESGLSADDVRRYLSAHGRTALPENVAQVLSEWFRKRETLVIRTGVSIALGSNEGHATAVDHAGEARRSWVIEEDGRVRIEDRLDGLALARLQRCAERAGGEWRVTAESVRHGLPAQQIIDWLRAHARRDVPPMVEVAVRNWAVRGRRVDIGEALFLRVTDAQAWAALAGSERFRPFVAERIPPEWFILRGERRQEIDQFLAELGFLVRSDVGALTCAGPRNPGPRV